MDLGVAVFATDRSWALAELAPEVEARGLTSLGVPEHTHLPVATGTGPGGRELPEEYQRTLDPFVALATAAAVTEQLTVMTAVCLVAQREPLVLAKEVASLDHVSGGRVTFGIGYGWNQPEIEHHGVAFDERRVVVHERLRAMKAVWRQEVAAVATPHVRFGPTWSWPKPVRAPHPPVLLGAGLGPRTLAAVVEDADGWMPVGTDAALEGLPRLRTAWTAAGRDGHPTVHALLGRPDAQAVTALAAAGVDAVSIWLPSAPRQTTLPVLDEVARLAAEHGPAPT